MARVYYDRQGKPITADDFADKHSSCAYKIVARTDLPNGGCVSTVWLGIDHRFGDGPPLIFETMVFPTSSMVEVDCERYSTEADALAGHKQMVEKHNG